MPYTFLDQIRLLMKGMRDELSQADCYFRGLYVEREPKTALMLYKRAVDKGLPGANFKLGLYYHHQLGSDKKAAKAYFDAIQEGELRAKPALEMLINSGSRAARFYLGYAFERQEKWQEAREHYEAAARFGSIKAMLHLAALFQSDRALPNTSTVVIRKDVAQELNWYKEAAVLDSAIAITALNKHATMNAQAAFYLGFIHELKGDAQSKAVGYYLKASQLKHDRAAFELGKIYETGRLRVTSDKIKASEFYLLAIQYGHGEALNEAERLITTLENQILEYKLAEVYFSVVKNKMKALSWYKKTADRGHKQAASKLYEIASVDGAFAYALGQAYEEGIDANPQKAFAAYAIAMRNNHQEARRRLEGIVGENNSDAQYALAYEYYHHKKNTREAVKWCVRAAEQGHQQALKYLTETKFDTALYLELAGWYEKGIGVEPNMNRAIFFYIKAYDSGDVTKALRIAHLFEKASGRSEENVENACKYYIRAVNHGFYEALDSLERLAESASMETQLAVAQLCRSPFVGQPLKALFWERKAGGEHSVGSTFVTSTVLMHIFRRSAVPERPVQAGGDVLKKYVVSLG